MNTFQDKSAQKLQMLSEFSLKYVKKMAREFSIAARLLAQQSSMVSGFVLEDSLQIREQYQDWILTVGCAVAASITCLPCLLRGSRRGERPARPTGAACAKKGRLVGGVGCPPNCRTSGKLRGSSGKLRPFRTFKKMLHFGKIPKNFDKIWRKFRKTLAKFATFWGKTAKIQQKFSNC